MMPKMTKKAMIMPFSTLLTSLRFPPTPPALWELHHLRLRLSSRLSLCVDHDGSGVEVGTVAMKPPGRCGWKSESPRLLGRDCIYIRRQIYTRWQRDAKNFQLTNSEQLRTPPRKHSQSMTQGYFNRCSSELIVWPG